MEGTFLAGKEEIPKEYPNGSGQFGQSPPGLPATPTGCCVACHSKQAGG